MSTEHFQTTLAELSKSASDGLIPTSHCLSIIFDEIKDALKKLESDRAEALAIGQELADIASHCIGWHIDVAGNFKSDHTLGLSRKITDALQRWSKLKEAVK